MTLSVVDQARLNQLEVDIAVLRSDIYAYKEGRTPADIRDNPEHRDYLHPLNTLLAGYEADARELRAKASPPQQRGE